MILSTTKWAKSELRAVVSIGSILSLRMLGFFMILPIFSPYAQTLAGATPTLAGIAFGIYGLTQALLQLPFGWLSDRFGRKPIIVLGLLCLILGSLISALSTSIIALILGRALQGAGAVGGVLMALTADLTQTNNRSKAMAIIGFFIGLSFFVAIISGSLLSRWIGVSGIFYLIAGLAIVAIGVLYLSIPATENFPSNRQQQTKFSVIKSIGLHPPLIWLNFGIFTQHAIFSSCFFILPLLLNQLLMIPVAQQWHLYLPLLLGSFLCMLPLLIIGEKKQNMHTTMRLLIVSQVVILFLLGSSYHHLGLLISWLFLYFIGFQFFEASLPALVSKITPQRHKGSAMGLYSSCQFLGVFFGATLAGWLFEHATITWIFTVNALLSIIWLAMNAILPLNKALSVPMPVTEKSP